MKAYLWGIVILLLLSACSQDSILEGISQDSGRDSKIEQARINLNNSNFDQVISDLSLMYTTSAIDTDVAQILASAYMGKAGVDLTVFISTSTSSGLNPFDIAGTLITSSSVTIKDKGRYIDGSLITKILDNITKAEETLLALEKYGKASSDDRIQLGIASAAHFIMNLGNKTADGLNTTLLSPYESSRKPGSVPVPINSKAYNLYVTGNTYYWPFIVPSTYIYVVSTNLSSFQRDLININNAVNAFSAAYPKNNPMRNSLNSFLYSALGVKPEVTITDELIMTYTSTGVYNYVQSIAH
jgi:hypothetical protein